MKTKTYTVIVFFQDGRAPFKYRNVNVTRFEWHARAIGAWYVNIYDPENRAYVGRIYYNEKGPGGNPGR
jgi:hypothetical protein